MRVLLFNFGNFITILCKFGFFLSMDNLIMDSMISYIFYQFPLSSCPSFQDSVICVRIMQNERSYMNKAIYL